MGKEIAKDCWLNMFYSQRLSQKQLHETLEMKDENESVLYVMQKTKAHTLPAEQALHIRHAN